MIEADVQLELKRAVDGDRAALRKVVGRNWPMMRRWALLQCGDAVVAEDAVQDALVRLIRFIGRFDVQRPFTPWLRTLVRNACRDELSRRRRAPVPSENLPERSVAERGPARTLDMQRAASQAIRSFALLTARQREVIDLVDVQDLSPTEAAELLDLSPGAVRSTLHDGRRRLRLHLEEGRDILPLLREA